MHTSVPRQHCLQLRKPVLDLYKVDLSDPNHPATERQLQLLRRSNHKWQLWASANDIPSNLTKVNRLYC
jgi:hypothetical protein